MSKWEAPNLLGLMTKVNDVNLQQIWSWNEGGASNFQAAVQALHKEAA